MDPFERFLAYQHTESRLVTIATAGIGSLVGQANLAKAVHEYREKYGPDPDRSKAQWDRAKEMAALAEAELQADFPLLHAHSLMGSWGALETLVHDVVTNWLIHRPSLMRHGNLGTVKVPLADFETMSKSERIEHLLNNVPSGTGVSGGFPRLEAQLEYVGLSGAVPDGRRKVLIEAHQVRNLYAHCGGVIDKRAIQICRWRTDWVQGQQATIDHTQWHQYLTTMGDYALELMYRSADKVGVDLRPAVGADEV